MQPLDAYRNSGLINQNNNPIASNSMLLDRNSNLSAYDKSGDQTPLKLKSAASASLGRPIGSQGPLSASNNNYAINNKRNNEKYRPRKDSSYENRPNHHATLVDTLS